MTATKVCTESIILARLMDSRVRKILLLTKPDCLCNTGDANALK